MATLHIKHFEVIKDTNQLYADLQFAKDESSGDYVVRVRLTRRTRKIEHFLGYALVNRACELLKLPEGLEESEQTALESLIKGALS